MTRTRVQAQQARIPKPSLRLVRGTIAAATATSVTVQLAGGSNVQGLPIPGAVYTIGAACLVLAQEPAVGPVYPLPGTTAVPAIPPGIAAGSGGVTGRCAMQLNSARTITGNAWWDLQFDTYVSGADGPMAISDGVGIKLPWAGRYSIFARAAIAGGDIPATSGVGFRAYRVSDGYLWSEQGQYGARSDLAMTLVDEITANANDVIRFCIWVPATGRALSFGADAYRTRCAVRYLGPV